MKKLIDLLNELAVAEAETDALEAKIEELMGEAEELDMTTTPELEELDRKYEEAYNIEWNLFNKAQDMLTQIGIDRKTARAMLITKRSELVKIASKEA